MMLSKEEGNTVKLWGGIILAWLVLMALLSIKALAQEPLHRFGVLPGEYPMDHYNVYLCPPRSTAATSALEYWAWRSLLAPPLDFSVSVDHHDVLEEPVWELDEVWETYDPWTYTAWEEPSYDDYFIDFLED